MQLFHITRHSPYDPQPATKAGHPAYRSASYSLERCRQSELSKQMRFDYAIHTFSFIQNNEVVYSFRTSNREIHLDTCRVTLLNINRRPQSLAPLLCGYLAAIVTDPPDLI